MLLQRVAWLVALVLVASPARADLSRNISDPAASGQQLLFVFDARDGRTTYLTISAAILPPPASVSLTAGAALPGESATLEIAFYAASLASRLGDRIVTIGNGQTIVIDPRSPEYAPFAAGQSGLVVVTPVISAEDRHPVTLNGSLLGSFTIANTTLGSGFGGAAAARNAVDRAGAGVAGGTVVDGDAVRYQQISPRRLTLSGFFNPKTLGRPEDDGNRLVFVAFDDVYGMRFDVQPLRLLVIPRFASPAGIPITGNPVCTDGILFKSLQELASPAVLDAAGFAGFTVQGPDGGNLFGFFSESLGTYGAGQRLVADPVLALARVSATPAPAACPEPTPSGIP